MPPGAVTTQRLVGNELQVGERLPRDGARGVACVEPADAKWPWSGIVPVEGASMLYRELRQALAQSGLVHRMNGLKRWCGNRSLQAFVWNTCRKHCNPAQMSRADGRDSHSLTRESSLRDFKSLKVWSENLPALDGGALERVPGGEHHGVLHLLHADGALGRGREGPLLGARGRGA